MSHGLRPEHLVGNVESLLIQRLPQRTRGVAQCAVVSLEPESRAVPASAVDVVVAVVVAVGGAEVGAVGG